MDDFLAKPLRLRELEATLRHWVDPVAAAEIDGDEVAFPEEPKEESEVEESEVESQEVESAEGEAADEEEMRGIDLETIAQIRQLGQDLGRDLLGQVVKGLLDSLPERMAELRRHQQEEDGEELRGLAHSLKGSTGNAGIIGLSELFSELQEETDAARIETLLSAAEDELRRVEPRVRRLLKEG